VIGVGIKEENGPDYHGYQVADKEDNYKVSALHVYGQVLLTRKKENKRK